MTDVRHIGVILFDGFEELDAFGPMEVFGMSYDLQQKEAKDFFGYTESKPGMPHYKIVTVTVPGNPGGKHVRASGGVNVVADYTSDDASLPPLDVVVVPGGRGVFVCLKDQSITTWLAGICNRATWTTSVCNGTMLLHAAGLLVDKRVATHWAVEDILESMGSVTVVRGKRYVVDGSLVTSQGISAGIDMALWLVGQLHSPEHARVAERCMQYEPEPPYQDVQFSLGQPKLPDMGALKPDIK